MGYIDIHAHIIPGIDDGPKNNRESVEMLKAAYESGITSIIATPHYSKGFCDYSVEDVKKYCRALDKYAKANISPTFHVYAGQEIFYNEKSLEMIKSGQVLPLADSQYILLEFEPGVAYQTLYQALREIAMSPYFPVLAHIERYRCLREQDRVDELHQLGVMLQMNYAHINGKVFDTDAKWCRKMLKQGLVDILSTDMHDTGERGVRMEQAFAWMKKNLDEEYLEELTSLNAKAILKQREIKEDKHE